MFRVDDEEGQDFKDIIMMMTNLKIYIQQSVKNQEMIENVITSFITDRSEKSALHFKDINMHEVYRIQPVLG